MISRCRFLVISLFGVALLNGSMPRAAAQAVDPETHPASKVVSEYLTMILARQWNKSADIVDTASLKGLQEDYLKRIGAAPTMDDEENMVRRVGKGSVEEVKGMTPREFYTAYHAGLQERYKVDEEVLKTIRDTLTIKQLSLAQEGDRTVHILVRTKHSNAKVMIENLELVSLVKNGDKWQVALNEQAPKVTPLAGAAGGTKAPDPGKLADPVKPATDPVKPAPKPKRK